MQNGSCYIIVGFNYKHGYVFLEAYFWAVTLMYIGSDDNNNLISRLMGPTCGPSRADRTQAGPMLALWTLLSGILFAIWCVVCNKAWHWSVIQARWSLMQCHFIIRIMKMNGYHNQTSTAVWQIILQCLIVYLSFHQGSLLLTWFNW